jgi:3-phytase
LLAAALALGAGCRAAVPPRGVAATPLPVAVATEPAGEDADDPGIWVNRARPADSRVIATNKAAAPRGALVVYGLDGRVRQRIAGLDRPNNVDVEYGFRLGGGTADLAVVTERYRRRLRAFRIRPDGALEDVSSPDGLGVFEGEAGERGAPMGLGLYKRPADGAVFAIVSRKQMPAKGGLWQYRLEDDGAGRVRAVKVRELGTTSPPNEVEAVLVDDARGVVYYAEEPRAIHQWRADPDHPGASSEIARIGRAGFQGDREGLALYAPVDAAGLLLATDQLPGASRYLLFRLEAAASGPADPVAVLEGGADATDGLDATAEPLGPAFPHGLVVAMNSRGRNFLYYRPEHLGLPLLP